VLKSPTIIVIESISPFRYINICFTLFGCFNLGTIYNYFLLLSWLLYLF
jgi:hypothetical protein